METKGQVLLIAIFMVLFLVLTIPVIVFLNRTGGIHQISSQQRAKAEPIAQAGIAYAMNLLSSTPTWSAALVGSFPAACTPGTNNPIAVGTLGSFALTCSITTPAFPIRPYQVAVTADAWVTGMPTNGGPLRTEQAIISQKTLVATRGNGLSVPVALELVNVPSISSTTLPTAIPDPLIVHWGPIAVYSSATWTLMGDANYTGLNSINTGSGLVQGFPRKFSLGGITGPTCPKCSRVATSTETFVSDEAEYWAFASMDVPPVIDTTSYLARSLTTAVDLSAYGAACAECTVTTSCGCMDVGVTTITINAMPALPPSAVIYVRGNVLLTSAASLDLRPAGALISTGTLTLGTHNPGDGFAALAIFVSSTAPREYPYWSSATAIQWPCANKVMTTCPSTTVTGGIGLFRGTPPAGLINIYGFVYAEGGMIVSNQNWNLAGGVLVGDIAAGTGMLTIQSNSSLTLVYDDSVVHNVQVQNFSLKLDSQQFRSP